MATKPKVTAQAEPNTTKSIMVPVTPKKRVKNPPPTLTEMVSAVRLRLDGLALFRNLLVEMDRLTQGGLENLDAKAYKENTKERRAVKADIRRANRILRRYERALLKGETIVKR